MAELLVTLEAVIAAFPKFATLPSDEQTALIASASQQVLDYTRRPGFLQSFLTETLDGKGLPRVWLSMRPIRTIAAVAVNGEALDNADGMAWFVKPGTGMLFRSSGDLRFGWGWPAGTGNIVVQYWGGYDEVPPPVVRATIFAVQVAYRQGLVSGIYQSESIGDYSYTLATKLPGEGVMPSQIASLLAAYVQDDAAF